MLKIRRPLGRLIFNMGIAIPGKTVFLIETAPWFSQEWVHYNDVIMGAMASQITSLTIVYSTVYSDADQRKHQSSASLAFVQGIHRGLVNSPHKWPVTRKNVSIWWRYQGVINLKGLSQTADSKVHVVYMLSHVIMACTLVSLSSLTYPGDIPVLP